MSYCNIFIISNIKIFRQSSFFNFQVRVRAYDNGQPAKDNVTVVTVTIQRNLAAPVINPTFIPARISEYTNLGIPVTRVNATDADPQPPHNTIRYTLYAGSLASEYFFLDDVTGDIYVKKSLTLDAGQNLQYTVGHMLLILSSFIINWITLKSICYTVLFLWPNFHDATTLDIFARLYFRNFSQHVI